MEPKAGTKTKTKPDSPASNGNASGDWFELPAEQRPKYQPETCGERPIQGYLLSRLELRRPATDSRGGTWWAYLIRLTQPTLAVDSEKGAEPKLREVGTEVLLPENVKLEELGRFLHPEALVEVRVQPVEKVSLGGGRTMWRFAIAANKKSLQPRGIYAREVPLLAAGSKGGANAGGDDIPF